MSRYHGKQGRGAAVRTRVEKRQEAEARHADERARACLRHYPFFTADWLLRHMIPSQLRQLREWLELHDLEPTRVRRFGFSEDCSQVVAELVVRHPEGGIRSVTCRGKSRTTEDICCKHPDTFDCIRPMTEYMWIDVRRSLVVDLVA